MDKVKARSLIDTAAIKAELQYTIASVNNMDQGKIRPIKYLKSEVKRLEREMIDAPHLERWSEYTYSAITLVLELLDERMNHLDINASTGVGGVGVVITYIEAFKDKWK